MAAERGRTEHSVAERLEEEPYRFDFYQAVSLIERMRPGAPSVGASVDADAEAVRFSSDPAFGFPPSEVAAIEAPSEHRAPWRMRVTFLGLAGVQGPLPRALVEWILGQRARGRPIREFFDIFHHRLVSLMYRVRRRQRVGLDGRPPDASSAAPFLAAVAGLDGEHLRHRLHVHDRSLLQYAALLAHRPRTAVGLERILSSYFGVPAHVRQFVGRWRALEDDDRTRIGRTGRAQILGESAVLGGRVWDQQSAVTLVVGPMSLERYRTFLPTGSALAELRDLAALYLGPEMEFDVQLVLRAREVPDTELHKRRQAQLGWTSWLATTRPYTHNPRVALGGENP
jgi:type VI secretion system protein ImpH